jgi:hypothetical protein
MPNMKKIAVSLIAVVAVAALVLKTKMARSARHAEVAKFSSLLAQITCDNEIQNKLTQAPPAGPAPSANKAAFQDGLNALGVTDPNAAAQIGSLLNQAGVSTTSDPEIDRPQRTREVFGTLIVQKGWTEATFRNFLKKTKDPDFLGIRALAKKEMNESCNHNLLDPMIDRFREAYK